jgi:hypothetical protein
MAEGATRQRGRDGDAAWLVVAGPRGGHVLVRSTVAEDRTMRIPLPETWSGTVRAYDDRGRRLSDAELRGTEIDAPVAAGGFTIIAGRSRATALATTPQPPALRRRGSKVG